MARFSLLIAVSLCLVGGPAAAQQVLEPKLAGADLVMALKRGGFVLLMRHAPTDPVAIDPGEFNLRDCSTQRNLSTVGRETAEQLGKAFARLAIPIGQVFSSPYCRCLDTGRLAFGRVTESPLLSVWDTLSVEEKSARGGEVRGLLSTAPQAGANTVLITHTGTLLYSFGLKTRPEGISHVFRPRDGQAEYIGSMAPADWLELAGLTPAQAE
jgi:phosphohistidine phosphatase SixA